MGSVIGPRKPPWAAVAIKVLPDVFARHGAIARFEREAKVLALLNHPHLAAIYGWSRPRPTFPGARVGRGETLASGSAEGRCR